jgi:hypothetical protein
MSLENIDEKFDKVAKNFSKKDKDPPPQQPTTEPESETYEKSFEKRQVSGLLSVFENHLRQQLKKEKEETDKQAEQSDAEFRTVELNMSEVAPTPDTSIEKVTPEEIDSLIKFSKKPTIVKKPETTTVDNTVYTQRRYDDTIEPVDNIASIDDPKISKTPTDTTPRYTDSHPTVDNSAGVDDVLRGLPPINKTIKGTSPTSEVVATNTTHHNADDNVSPEVLQHIEAHRKKKEQSDNLPDNYIKEDKN